MKCEHIIRRGDNTGERCVRNSEENNIYCNMHKNAKRPITKQIKEEDKGADISTLLETIKEQNSQLLAEVNFLKDDYNDLEETVLKVKDKNKELMEAVLLLVDQNKILMGQNKEVLKIVKELHARPSATVSASDEGIAASITGNNNNIKPVYNITFHGELASISRIKLYSDKEIGRKISDAINSSKDVTNIKDITTNIIKTIQETYGYKEEAKFTDKNKHDIVSHAIKYINDNNETLPKPKRIKINNISSADFANVWAKLGNEQGIKMLKNAYLEKDYKKLCEFKEDMYSIFST
jgi:hypothetical protein